MNYNEYRLDVVSRTDGYGVIVDACVFIGSRCMLILNTFRHQLLIYIVSRF